MIGQPARQRWRSIAGPALVLIAAGSAVLPEMLRGSSCGHDFDFHLVSWLDTVNSWRHGILYPHWTPSPNYGAGEPRFVFYPPLTWMLGAALGLVLPWKALPVAISFILLAATGLATRALARQVFSDAVATLAGVTSIFCGYTLFTAYERSAFAEMTGGFWVPLMLMLILREGSAQRSAEEQGKRAGSLFNGSVAALSLVVAGAWLSNAPVGVMLSYLLAGVALTVAVLSKSWLPALRAAIAAALGLGLAAVYLVPAAWEQRWVAIRQAIDDPGLLIENSWLFARHADPRLDLHDIELIRVSFIAVTMVVVAVAALVVALMRRTLPARRSWWVPLALIPPVVLLLLLPISLPGWNALPKLRFLQFPWRWLLVVEAPMSIFFAAAVWPQRRWRRVAVLAVCVAFYAAATTVAYVSLFQGCDPEDSVRGRLANYEAGTGFEGTDEYAPPGADNSLVATELPEACLVSDPTSILGKGDPDMAPEWSADQGSCEATLSAGQGRPQGSPEHLRIAWAVPHAGYLVLRLRAYPAWKVTLNGRPAANGPAREDGLMTVPVQAGTVDLAVDWKATTDVLAGRAISAIALLLVTGVGLLERRRFQARLS